MDKKTVGWINGALGMIAFSGSMPATRVAVLEMSPLFLTGARAVIAAVLGALCLIVLRAERPRREEIIPLMLAAFGVVVAFPLLSAMALREISSVHSIVFTGLLPVATTTFAVLRGEARPSKMFWLFSGLGSACILIYAFSQGFALSPRGDLLMLMSIIVCGMGYAEGARLARRLGGWQVICWALLIALPVMVPVMIWQWPQDLGAISPAAWTGLGYVSLFSMLIGFIFWYRGLALGGIAAVGQLQLLQPFLSLVVASVVLKEVVGPQVLIVMACIVLCVLGAKRFAST
ncbi:DMT family transporter [Asticcacaulis machinosus]|uniref:DMT family transporter n=1 Tax=Asticcacaulis machinosus TaxID=2984211 RepID=A0ABT5HMF6_9CAUL|nr:DMT family transporter [Asticcacaulis machinosus]MDC7677431.1 DMT family transporter [Asticcacaulis machinosus]